VILAGDIGATKILLEVGEARRDHWEPRFSRRYPLADFDGMPSVLDQFLGEWNTLKDGDAPIRAAAIGAAGPQLDNCIHMTNRAWIVDGTAIARRLGIPRATVVNDLAAAAHGLEWLKPNDLMVVQPGHRVAKAPTLVVGVGTGLGIAYVVDGVVVPSEGGHAGFSPASAEQTAVWRNLAERHGRVEAESVASGIGMTNIHLALHGRDGTPAHIVSQALDHRDPDCQKVLEVFAECLGNVAGDHALSVMARGGVYLAGGLLARIAPHINFARFRSAFCAKGALSSLLMTIPVFAITNEHLAVLGAARIANRAV